MRYPSVESVSLTPVLLELRPIERKAWSLLMGR